MSETRARLGLQVIRDRAGEAVAFIAPADELDLLIDQKEGAVTLLEGLMDRLVDLSNSGQLSETGFRTLRTLFLEGSQRHGLDFDRARVERDALRGRASAPALERSINEGVREAGQQTDDDDESKILALALKRLSSGQAHFPSAKVKTLLTSLETLASSKEVDASDVEKLINGLSGE